MPIYYYRGIDREKKAVAGVMAADDEPNLEEKLKQIGCWLVHAEAEKPRVMGMEGFTWRQRIQRRDLIDFFTQLSFQTRAGVPLIQAIESAYQECSNQRFRLMLESIHRNMEAGSLFYEALDKYPEAFSPHVVSLVRAGELSGRLPETCADLKKYMEWVQRVMEDVRQASTYPLIVAGVISVFVLVLFVFVIPRFVTLLEATNAPLPGLTLFVFSVSDVILATWWVWLPLLLLGPIALRGGRRVSPAFAYRLDQIRLKLPALGEINQMIAISRFTHNFGIMYRSGIPILQALRLCQGLVDNGVVERGISEVEKLVASGERISEAISQQAVFPAMVTRMVLIGEKSGELEKTLEDVSAYFEEMIPRRIKRLFSYFEPALMLVLIGVVGTVALAIFLPLVSLMGGID